MRASKKQRWAGPAGIVLLTGLIFFGSPSGQARGKTLIWKQLTQVLLKENNHPVKTWSVYQPDKNKDLLLVQVDRDWFIFSLKEKRLYRAERSDFQSQGDALTGPEPDSQTPVVKTDGWDSHDVGPAQQISVRFAESGDVLVVELPHPLAIY